MEWTYWSAASLMSKVNQAVTQMLARQPVCYCVKSADMETAQRTNQAPWKPTYLCSDQGLSPDT